MAHKKGQGSSQNQKGKRRGKRLGLKIFGGQQVQPGNIILGQRGKNFHPGEGVILGKDFTIQAKIEGVVTFTHKDNSRKYVNVFPTESK